MKMFLTILGVIIGIVVLYLVIVTFAPGFSVSEQPLRPTRPTVNEAIREPASAKKDVSFDVDGTPISAWLFLPNDVSAPVPCVVMGHGFGGTRAILLERYAARFAQAGFAALVFDYRHFGDSGGEPRQLVWIPYQLEDWAAAVDYARGLKEVDPAKIALWGTSMSGGHVIVTAASDHKIACVSAQCPGLDGQASGEMWFKKVGLGYTIRFVAHGQRDIIRGRLGLAPHKIPIVGKPGDMAVMAVPGAIEFFEKYAPPDFVNEVCARINLRGGNYRPVEHAKNVRCPVLLQIADNDELVPLTAAHETEKNLGEYAEVKHNPIGHFDIYIGDNYEKCVSEQVEFFKKHL